MSGINPVFNIDTHEQDQGLLGNGTYPRQERRTEIIAGVQQLQRQDSFEPSNNGDPDDYAIKLADSSIKTTAASQSLIKKEIKDKFDKGEKTSSSGKKLSDDAQKVVKNLETIDSKVKTHENAHKAAGGNLVRGGASYNYESGPDGRQYAVSGEVQIELSADPSNPQATIQKMQQVKRAALAPADPSGQDRAVAAMASSIESQARAELSARNADKPKLNAKLGSLYKNKPAGSELIDGKS